MGAKKLRVVMWPKK